LAIRGKRSRLRECAPKGVYQSTEGSRGVKETRFGERPKGGFVGPSPTVRKDGGGRQILWQRDKRIAFWSHRMAFEGGPTLENFKILEVNGGITQSHRRAPTNNEKNKRDPSILKDKKKNGGEREEIVAEGPVA